jgi:hypothetical protein
MSEEWTPRFEYTDDEVDNYAPDIGGVYRLIYKHGEKPDDYFIFYVGETDNLYKALQDHLNLLDRELPPPPNPYNAPDHCIKRTLQESKCYFRFIIIRSKKKRIRIKEKLENSYIPKGDMEFAAWADNFIRVLSANAHKWGIPPEAWAHLAGTHKEYMASYDAHLKAKIDIRKARQKLKDAQQEGEEWKGGDLRP